MADSYSDWWSLAGVDSLVGETPAGWLSAPAPSEAPASRKIASEISAPAPDQSLARAKFIERVEVAATAPKAPAVMPAEWSAFQDWLATADDVPGSQWDARRVLPTGAANAPLMLLTAWPEIDDQRDGALFSGDAGTLFDAMLRAIGLARTDCYCASLAVTRPPGGRCDANEIEDLDRLLWHHLRIAAPQRLLLIGSDMLRLGASKTLTETRGKLLDLNQDGINMDAVAVAHPAMLLARPAQKAAAWDSLKLLTRGR